MSDATDLIAAKNTIVGDAAIINSFVNGPASGGSSIITLPGGANIKTLARIAAEATAGYLPLAGGTVTGLLTAQGGLRARGGGNFSSNVAVGDNALGSNSGGLFNTAVGSGALQSNTTGANNTAVGLGALNQNTIGISNTAVGYAVLNNNTIGINNTGVGLNTLVANTSGSNNTGIGVNSLLVNTIGSGNTALGVSALGANTTASNNTAIGFNALTLNSTGIENTAVGANALASNSTGSDNSALGLNALAAVTTGGQNVGIGAAAGSSLTTGVNNIIIGFNAQPSAVGASNEITLGNSSIATIRAQVTSITSLSDRRFKSKIKPTKLGLALINDLDVDEWVWNSRDKSLAGQRGIGFLAQDLQKVQAKHKAQHLKLVYASNPKRLEATPGNLLPVAIKAIQELSQQVRALQAAA